MEVTFFAKKCSLCIFFAIFAICKRQSLHQNLLFSHERGPPGIMSETIQKTIDIDKVLRDKMGDKAKWVPKPAVSWLKKTIHQDRVNAFLVETEGNITDPTQLLGDFSLLMNSLFSSWCME